MTVPNFMSKEFSYQDLRREGGGTMCPASPPGMIRIKYPGEDRIKENNKASFEKVVNTDTLVNNIGQTLQATLI